LEIVAPVGLGLILGSVVVLSTVAPSDWAGLMLLATLVPTIALLMGDMKKLLLTILIVDVVLGLDISLGNRPEHLGGPGGLVISLMSIALVIAYFRWFKGDSMRGRSAGHIPLAIAVPAVVYVFASLVSTWQATEVWLSIAELFLQLQFLLMFFFVAFIVKTWADVRFVVTILAVCLLLEGVLMLFQYYGGLDFSGFGVTTQAIGSEVASAPSRVGGTFSGPNIAATFLAASLAITIAAYMTDGQLVNKRLAAAAFFVGLAALAITQSRSGWIAFGVALLILLQRVAGRRIGAKSALPLLAILVILAIAFSTVVVERFTTEDQSSSLSRVWHSEMALNIIKDHTFLGVGANNQRFAIDSGEYSPPELVGKESEVTAIHNTYLAIWAETGLFGFLAFVWLVLAAMASALVASVRTRDKYAAIAMTGFLAAVAVYAVHLSTGTFTGRRMQFLWFLIGLIAATFEIIKETAGMEGPLQQFDSPDGGGSGTSFGLKGI
jgi:putative inorganic carbon (HCO3(-)) transporter